MDDRKEAELQNAARRVVALLRTALADKGGPSSPNNDVVQGEQGAVRNRQPATQGQHQIAPGNSEQAGTRQPQVAQGQQQQRTPGFPRTARNRVEQNMASSFPSLFKSGRGCTPSLKRKATKSNSIQFFLLDKRTERTPKSSEEMMLLQAGLGRRTLSIPENADHSEISKLLLETYSKMVELEGAWMLYKAAGGSGQRKLAVVAPEAEGYTGSYLARASGGKSCLYILPIQDTLDTSPLPYTSTEFERMPKARCSRCHKNMPVQLLALHSQECMSGSFCETIDLEQNLDVDVATEVYVSPGRNSLGNVSPGVQPCFSSTPKEDVKVACPLCCQFFPKHYVEVHASTCGEGTMRKRRMTLTLKMRKPPMLWMKSNPQNLRSSATG
ncbi:uncharacterized protein LOC117823783 [Notolabrus celidotus]|uniref:uncharacterized protein LOC117823783 n=1 Tax=Notolabrus celidotus TaxID=1203425 RepID=UPI00149056B2|nr:uncharacterized protein LOC117823783 [Notolabrus celidotus]